LFLSVKQRGGVKAARDLWKKTAENCLKAQTNGLKAQTIRLFTKYSLFFFREKRFAQKNLPGAHGKTVDTRNQTHDAFD